MFTDKPKIVVVEDDKVTLTVLKSIVSDLGAEVINFTAAAPALEYIQKDESDQVKVLVTDINMPEMTGDILTREVLQLKPWIDVYVITSTNTMSNVIPTYMAGAREILLKPINKSTLAPFIVESLNRNKRWMQFLVNIKNSGKEEKNN